MKSKINMAKIIGIAFVVVGMFFAAVGAIQYVVELTQKDERIYTTAEIVRIDERKTNDPDDPTDHTAYVEAEVKGEKITAKLNTYKSSFKVGKEIDIYYFENDPQTAYEKGSDIFFLIFSSVGIIFAIIGVVIVINAKHIRGTRLFIR